MNHLYYSVNYGKYWSTCNCCQTKWQLKESWSHIHARILKYEAPLWKLFNCMSHSTNTMIRTGFVAAIFITTITTTAVAGKQTISVISNMGSSYISLSKVLKKCTRIINQLNQSPIINNYWTRLSKTSWFVSGEQINYLPIPKAEANNWSESSIIVLSLNKTMCLCI